MNYETLAIFDFTASDVASVFSVDVNKLINLLELPPEQYRPIPGSQEFRALIGLYRVVHFLNLQYSSKNYPSILSDYTICHVRAFTFLSHIQN